MEPAEEQVKAGMAEAAAQQGWQRPDCRGRCTAATYRTEGLRIENEHCEKEKKNER